MIDPVVRVARADDAAEVAALSTVARAALVEQRGGPRWLDEHPEHADWKAFIAEVPGTVLVADLDGLVVGYLVVVVDGHLAQIDEVFVRPEARELGFGDALLAAAIDHGRRAGADLVEGEALPGDRTVKNLFERAGLTARKIIVSAPISDPATSVDASR